MLQFLRCFGLAYTLVGKSFSADGSTPQCISDPITPCLNTKALFGVCFSASFVPCGHSSVASGFQPHSFPESSLHLLHPAVVAAGYHGVNRMTEHPSELLSKEIVKDHCSLLSSRHCREMSWPHVTRLRSGFFFFFPPKKFYLQGRRPGWHQPFSE